MIYSAACRAINSVRLLLKRHELRKWAEGLRDRGGWTQAAAAAENPVFLAANSTDVISESARSKTNLCESPVAESMPPTGWRRFGKK